MKTFTEWLNEMGGVQPAPVTQGGQPQAVPVGVTHGGQGTPYTQWSQIPQATPEQIQQFANFVSQEYNNPQGQMGGQIRNILQINFSTSDTIVLGKMFR